MRVPAPRDEGHLVVSDPPLVYFPRGAQIPAGELTDVRDDAGSSYLGELLHVALLRPAHRIDALLREEVLGHVVDALLAKHNVRPGGFDLLDHRPEALLLFVQELLELRRIPDPDLLVHLGLLD